MKRKSSKGPGIEIPQFHKNFFQSPRNNSIFKEKSAISNENTKLIQEKLSFLNTKPAPVLFSKETQTNQKKNYYTALILLLASASLALVSFFPTAALYAASAFAILATVTFIKELCKPNTVNLR